MGATGDLGVKPEIDQWGLLFIATPWEAVRSDRFVPDHLLVAREAASDVGKSSQDQLLKALRHKNAAAHRWGAIGLTGVDMLNDSTRMALIDATMGDSSSLSIAAAYALAHHGETKEALPTLIEMLDSEQLTTVLYAARAIELLGDDAKPAIPAMEKTLARAEKIRPPDTPATVVTSGDQDLAMFIGFSTRAFLKKVKQEQQDAKGAQGDEGESGDSEWISLFDGKTLDGWTARAKGEVQAKDGEIQILSKGANLWLVHEDNFENFELTAEVKMPDDNYNSGIGFRCTGDGKPKGYQCEVDRAKSGMIYAIGSGWVWPKGKDESAKFKQMAGNCFDNDKWNEFRIRCEGASLQIWINGTQTADVHDDRFSQGAIALQHHGKGGLHRFRNIKIRKLP